MSPQQEIVQKFEALLGNDEFVTSGFLIKIGLYASHTSLAKALADGVLPSLKVSPNRTLIPRSAVLDHIRRNIRFREVYAS
jgi:hypothetical protein